MKVLHFISGGDTGGAKTHVLTLLSRLMETGVDVGLLCIMEGIFTDEARKLNIPVYIIPQKRRYDVTVLKKISAYINSSGCDLVHCHGARANYIAMFLKNKVKAPMVTTLHSDYKLDFKDTWYKQLVFEPINYFALKRFRYILTVTQAFKNMMLERGFKKERLFVVYNGINFDAKPEVINRVDFLKKYGIAYDKSKIYVGIAARLNVVKGVLNFLNAALRICSHRKDIVFLVAGTGDDFKKYHGFIQENSLSDRVFMLGHVNDIDSFYNAVDINTLTSLSESFPYALLEGARMKKATVSTDVGGISEMISDGKTGFLVKPGSIEELAARIELLAEDRMLAEKLGGAFYDFAKKNFSDRKMAETHKNIYEKIVKENFK